MPAIFFFLSAGNQDNITDPNRMPPADMTPADNPARVLAFHAQFE
jgi:hypothetical protein